VPQGGIPLDVGVLVQNVQTLAHVGDALDGRPVTHRFVTLAGAVARPITVEAPVGTPLSRLLELAGGATCDQPRYLAGGVMMGALVEEDFAVRKTTSGILVLPPDNPAVRERLTSLEREARVSKSVCDQCFTCTELCPRYLLGHDIQPHLLMRRAETVLERPGEADHIAWYCCECGVCSLIACPVRITPRRLIAAMKQHMPPPHKQPKQNVVPHPDYDRKGLPMSYVMMRLALESYAGENRFLGPLHDLDHVRICRGEFGGGLAEPLIEPGRRVIQGEPVAEGRHTRHHAPMAGRVTAVDDAITLTTG
jgi:Na+-translocating ferredoxin:NAD+ oxidoreductase RnfC subunit